MCLSCNKKRCWDQRGSLHQFCFRLITCACFFHRGFKSIFGCLTPAFVSQIAPLTAHVTGGLFTQSIFCRTHASSWLWAHQRFDKIQVLNGRNSPMGAPPCSHSTNQHCNSNFTLLSSYLTFLPTTVVFLLLCIKVNIPFSFMHQTEFIQAGFSHVSHKILQARPF